MGSPHNMLGQPHAVHVRLANDNAPGELSHGVMNVRCLEKHIAEVSAAFSPSLKPM